MSDKGSKPAPDGRTQDRTRDDEPDSSPESSHPDQIDHLSQQMLARLGHVIEGDIIPRLMLALDPPKAARLDAQTAERLRESVDEFVQLLVHHDASVASRFLDTLRADGTPLHTLYLDLLAPSARYLDVLWRDDEISFTDVTIACCRLHQLLLQYSRNFDSTAGNTYPGRNALVIPVPGEQHTFGIFMIMEFLRRADWHCFSGTPKNAREARKLAEAHDFDVIGLSLGAERHVDIAKRFVATLKDNPPTSKIPIVLGGRALVDNPDLGKDIGATAVASDARDAVVLFERLYEESRQIAAN